MITEKQYLDAVKTVKEYQNQINIIIDKVPKVKLKTCKKVKCVNTYAGGHKLYFLTIGKEYDIIHNPYRKASRSRDRNNENNFGVIDDNGKLRYFPYKNPSLVWEFQKLNKPAFINSVCLDSKYAIENICIRYNDDGTCRPCGFCKQTIEENNL